MLVFADGNNPSEIQKTHSRSVIVNRHPPQVTAHPLPQGTVKEKEGCFVFMCVGHIAVRSRISVGDECRTDLIFSSGELVSVDQVRYSRDPNEGDNGPFLRLSDGSGWLFEKKYGEPMMKWIDVDDGLWTFYVDNVPEGGMALTRHPVERNDLRESNLTYQAMQKIYCDRKVKHPDTGICFYRVQGTDGWVVDHRAAMDSKEARRDAALPTLLEGSMIQSGFFAYQNIHTSPIVVRKTPDISGVRSKTDIVVKPNEIVAVDVVRQSHSVGSDANGPFLRLIDGSGWLFEKKMGKCIMQQLPVTKGKWRFEVLNKPFGIALRRHPIDTRALLEGQTVYKPGCLVECTHLVCCGATTGSDVKFYKVKDKDGWIFDKRNGAPLLRCLDGDDESCWTPDSVRGIAAAIDHIDEISFNEKSKLISFRNMDNARINVYYTTRTVGTCLDHPRQGPTQMFRKDCSTKELVEIFQNPRHHTGKGYQHRRSFHKASSEDNANEEARFEQAARDDLCSLEKEIEDLQKKRNDLLKLVADIDLKRSKVESEFHTKFGMRQKEIEARLQACTCHPCNRVFVNENAKNQHNASFHGVSFWCNVCHRTFKNHHAMNQHKNHLDHWY